MLDDADRETARLAQASPFWPRRGGGSACGSSGTISLLRLSCHTPLQRGRVPSWSELTPRRCLGKREVVLCEHVDVVMEQRCQCRMPAPLYPTVRLLTLKQDNLFPDAACASMSQECQCKAVQHEFPLRSHPHSEVQSRAGQLFRKPQHLSQGIFAQAQIPCDLAMRAAPRSRPHPRQPTLEPMHAAGELQVMAGAETDGRQARGGAVQLMREETLNGGDAHAPLRVKRFSSDKLSKFAG